MKKLYRSQDAMLKGVCAGIADYLGIDKTVLRLIFALGTFFTGIFPGIVVYIICVVIMPADDNIIDE